MRKRFYLLLVLAVVACSENEATVALSGPQEPLNLRVLALGDSYTIGEAVAIHKRWPEQLADSLVSLRTELLQIESVDVTYLAMTGWTTMDLRAALDNSGESNNASYDIVSLLIGVNDQFAGFDIDLYDPAFSDLLEIAIELGGDDPGNVIVLSIPDYGATPVGQSYGAERIAREIDAYNAINYRIAVGRAVAYFDITPISRRGLDEPELVARDGLHPSGVMYAEWVSLLLPSLRVKFELQ